MFSVYLFVSLFCYIQEVNSVEFLEIVSSQKPYREYYVDALGEPSEKTWVPGKAIVLFEGRHQFEELPVLRKRGKQKEKDYKNKVKELFSVICFYFFESAQYKILCLDLYFDSFCETDCSKARDSLCPYSSVVYKLPGVSRLSSLLGCALLLLLPWTALEGRGIWALVWDLFSGTALS